MMVDQCVVLCGPFKGQGKKILEEWAVRARRIGVPIYLVSELYPATANNPDEIRAASRKAIRDPRTAGVIFAVLSHRTLQVQPGTDCTGGIGVERGIAFEQGKRVGFLFDDWRDLENTRISSLLRPGARELVFCAETPGDLDDLFAKCVNLALVLLEEASIEKQSKRRLS